jgi:hypothetical protein
LAKLNFAALEVSKKLVLPPINDSGVFDLFKGIFLSNDFYIMGFYS